MKHITTCPFHRRTPRPGLCNECKRAEAKRPVEPKVLKLLESDKDQLVRFHDTTTGKISFLVVGNLDLSKQSVYWD